MIILDSNSKSLQIISTVASLEWSVSYYSVVKSICPTVAGQNSTCSDCKTASENQGVTTNGTVTMLSAPTLSTSLKSYSYEIKNISILNVTVSTAVITIQITLSGNNVRILKVTIPSGYSADYEEQEGWKFFNSSGAPPSTASTVLTDGHILVGNGSNIATDVAMSGDVTIIDTGATTVNWANGETTYNTIYAPLGSAITVEAEQNTTPVTDNLESGIGAFRPYQDFVLPNTYKLYKITGIEWKNGATVNGAIMCGVDRTDASPPVDNNTLLVAFGKQINQSGASVVQRNSFIVSELIPGGTQLSAWISTNGTGTYRYVVGANQNRLKNEAFNTTPNLQDVTAWTLSTSALYIKIYYQGYN